MQVEPSDAELARNIANGSPEAEAAEAELCRRMWPRIRLYGMRHLRSVEAAEDLAQHVLVIALESLRAGKLQDPEKLAQFVLGISRMTVVDQRRTPAAANGCWRFSDRACSSRRPSRRARSIATRSRVVSVCSRSVNGLS